MGHKDATKIAKLLIEQGKVGGIHQPNTPVHILEAVSIPRERLWNSTLQDLANGKADEWFDSSSPALIMVGEALRKKINQTIETVDSESSSTKVDNCLQDGNILSHGLRRA